MINDNIVLYALERYNKNSEIILNYITNFKKLFNEYNLSSNEDYIKLICIACGNTHYFSYFQQQVFLYSKKYENNFSLGNTEIGDGEKYIGRGIIKIIGRNEYKKYSDILNLDLIENPSLVLEADVGSKIFFEKVISNNFLNNVNLKNYAVKDYTQLFPTETAAFDSIMLGRKLLKLGKNI